MRIRVKVITRAHEDSLTKKNGDLYHVMTKEKAEGGKANERVCEIVALSFGVDRKAVVITRGTTTSSKIIEIKGK